MPVFNSWLAKIFGNLVDSIVPLFGSTLFHILLKCKLLESGNYFFLVQFDDFNTCGPSDITRSPS